MSLHTALSKDGTHIAYEKTGAGPCILLINGALAHRRLYGETELSHRLSDQFTVIHYDRRGRGESEDTPPYQREREIEDIEALINTVSGTTFLYGSSGGAALALLAAAKLGDNKIKKLALYELPYGSASEQDYLEEKNKIKELIAAGKRADAVTCFMSKRGVPPEGIGSLRKSADWNGLVSVAHTLVYDFEVLGDGNIPADELRQLNMPVLVMDGEKSFDFVHETARRAADFISGSKRMTIQEEGHDVSAAAIAPILAAFFSDH